MISKIYSCGVISRQNTVEQSKNKSQKSFGSVIENGRKLIPSYKESAFLLQLAEQLKNCSKEVKRIDVINNKKMEVYFRNNGVAEIIDDYIETGDKNNPVGDYKYLQEVMKSLSLIS